MTVGDRGLRAAEPEACGPGRRSCRLRPHRDGAELVDPGDRAAARSDRDDVDHRATTGRPPTSVSVVSRIRPPSIKATSYDVPPTSAQIDVLVAELARESQAADHAAGGPDSSVRIGRSAARSAEMTPPFDCISASGR